jgi:hypothetical protein
VNTKTRLFVFAILIALLPGCGGGSAVDVAGKFWDAVNDGNLEKAKKYATQETAASLTMNDDRGDAEVDVEFGASTVEGERTIIETHMVTRMGDVNQTVDMKTVLVQEDGEWKVDIINTMMSMFGGAAQEMMQGMTEAMGQTMEDMGNVMMEEMQKAFAQLGTYGTPKSPIKGEPEMLWRASDYRIKFGYMKKRSDGRYYVHKETKKIPMRTGGFKWGYTIEAEGEPFATYTIDYSPDGPMSGYGYARTNAQGEQGWETNTTTVTSGYLSHVYNNDPGDTPGERKIEVYVEDRLATTIEFVIGNP